jgi:hypothetical protein
LAGVNCAQARIVMVKDQPVAMIRRYKGHQQWQLAPTFEKQA